MEQTDTDLQHEFEERLRFETLLAEISARYINLPASHLTPHASPRNKYFT